jgi:hypothetical protein
MPGYIWEFWASKVIVSGLTDGWLWRGRLLYQACESILCTILTPAVPGTSVWQIWLRRSDQPLSLVDREVAR